MKQLLSALAIAASLGAAGCAQAVDSASDLANRTIVIFNKTAPDSVSLARFYAAHRHIPNDHLVGLECSTEEEISRQEYDQTIAQPLRKMFKERHWWSLHGADSAHPLVTSNHIDFVALIRGMPLKIRATAEYAGDERANNPIFSQNEASVDSELAALGFFSRQISGVISNPYFQNAQPISQLDDSPLMLVCRLDAPSAAVVRRMISDAVETEKTGLWGRAYVDGAHNTSGGMADGDTWLGNIVRDLRRAGIPVVYDQKPAVFPSGYPMSDCALYYGWYAGQVAGPFLDPGFNFRRGAVAVHIHSFSASTLRYADANWVAPLLSKGAAASLGNVYEPYLQMTAHLDIFNDRLLRGFTFAESAYMATRGISWMNVVVGDPLYRPYLNWSQKGATRNSAQNNWQMYHQFAFAHSDEDRAKYLADARGAASRAGNGPMIEDLALQQADAGDDNGAISYLQQARTIYKQRGDLLRVVLEEADTFIAAGRKKEALTLVRNVSRLLPDSPSAALLKKIEAQLSPPTPSPVPTVSR